MIVRVFSFLAFIVVFMVQSAAAEVKDSVGLTKINNVLHVRYLVEPGETVYAISTKYHVSVSDLLELNPELEAGLKVGQVINIPYHEELVQKEKARNSGTAVVHKVESGETLYSLARKYNVGVDQLMKWNNMDLKVGQEIVIGYQDTQVATAKPATPEQVRVEAKSAPEPVKVVAVQEKPKEVEVVKPQETVKPEPKAIVEAPKPKPVVAEKAVEPTSEPEPAKIADTYPYDPDMQQILIIPFDPYLYFSDADHEIAAKSKVAPTKVREIFRRRLVALMQMPGYESIYLLGGKSKDSISDLNKIYSSVTYNYQEILDNPNYKGGDLQTGHQTVTATSDKSSWLDKQKNKYIAPQNSAAAVYDKREGQYFGVRIRNPEEFFAYFESKYSIDYYIFINQFEVKTNYENCLDRAAQNFERTFTTHYSIFDAKGKQFAGSKFKTFYNSNSSYIYTIVGDNMDKIAKRILGELPPPGK